MNKNDTSLPMIATSNGWTPIALFDFGSAYAEHQKFLVWMVDGKGNEWFETAHMKRGRILNDRAQSCSRSNVKPVAFKLVDGPDLTTLKLIFQRITGQFPCRKKHLPKLKFVAAEEEVN
jgi:hypothetical protein